jgi:SnoaL-like domain
MPTIVETIDTYAQAWSVTDAAASRRLLDAAWAEGGRYSDPMSQAEGRDGLAGLIAGFHQQMPGATIVRTSGVDEHHGTFRFTWAVKSADGSIAMEGVDFGELDGDGRVRRIIGFFGPPPPA